MEKWIFCSLLWKKYFFLLPLPKKIIIIFGRGSEKKPFFHFSNFLLTSPTKENNFLVNHLLSPKKFFLLPLPWGRSEKKVRGEKNFLYFPYLEIIIIFLVREVKFFFSLLAKKILFIGGNEIFFTLVKKLIFFTSPT